MALKRFLTVGAPPKPSAPAGPDEAPGSQRRPLRRDVCYLLAASWRPLRTNERALFKAPRRPAGGRAAPATSTAGDSSGRSFVPPSGAQRLPETPLPDCAKRVADVKRKGVPFWTGADGARRAALLRASLDLCGVHGPQAARALVYGVKGSYETGLGEELLYWAAIAHLMQDHILQLEGAHALDAEFVAKHARRHPVSGQQVVRLFPSSLGDALQFPGGYTGEVWIEPGWELRQDTMYLTGDRPPVTVCGVLGAGNHVCVVVSDILHQLLNENAVVVVKMSPVNEVCGPYLEEIFRPFVDVGAVAFVYGGLEQGKYLTAHPDVATVHVTGSGATFDAIVWQGKRKQGAPPFPKHVHAELGNKTPYIVCPGKWSAAELDRHARQVVTGKVNNVGHNCAALEVIVTSRDWPQREQFLARVRHHLECAANRVSYYPGSDRMKAEFCRRFPDCEVFEKGHLGGASAWLFQAGTSPETLDPAYARSEYFCGSLVEVAVPGATAAEFLPAAVDFCNDDLFGTLCASLFVDPATERAAAAAVDRALHDLRYGTVVVNGPTLLGFGISVLPWGGWRAGGTVHDIGSGNSFVHNTWMLQRVEKSVLRCPWRPPLYPAWAHDHPRSEALATGVFRHAVAPSFATFVTELVPEAVRGSWQSARAAHKKKKKKLGSR